MYELLHMLQVHLWDLSGDPQYYDVRNELYGGADACFIVFDVTNRQSFESLGKKNLLLSFDCLFLRLIIGDIVKCMQNLL